MTTATLLSRDDLAEIGRSAPETPEPRQLVTDLVNAVEEGQLADPADAGHALILAAAITERIGELPGAELLARRGVQADNDDGYARAYHAELLLRLGREDEGLAELTALRPQLAEDEDVIHAVTDALVGAERAGLAERWLSAALELVLRRRAELADRQPDPAYATAAGLAFTLLVRRHELRRELDLPHDGNDELADQVMDAVHDSLVGTFHDTEPVAVLYWPCEEFDRLLHRWPELAASYGETWDGHRGALEWSLAQHSESGRTSLAVTAGRADELAEFARRHEGDPTDQAIRQRYAQHLAEHPRATTWPPSRNAPCWCGSERKYKKCCLPRSRR